MYYSALKSTAHLLSGLRPPVQLYTCLIFYMPADERRFYNIANTTDCARNDHLEPHSIERSKGANTGVFCSVGKKRVFVSAENIECMSKYILFKRALVSRNQNTAACLVLFFYLPFLVLGHAGTRQSFASVCNLR